MSISCIFLTIFLHAPSNLSRRPIDSSQSASVIYKSVDFFGAELSAIRNRPTVRSPSRKRLSNFCQSATGGSTYVNTMNFSPSSSDPSLLDLETVTFEQWRLFIYNKVVHQKNIFIDDFKSKIINDIDDCMRNIQPDTTLECIHKDLKNRINENQFELEYQKFIDGIVGSTFEYFCQLIIKNSMDNIKRTQSVLNSFSLTNINGVTKPCCNEIINLQESSNLTQTQCLPESNNNTTISEKVIQSHLFNYSSQNDIVLFERENSGNIQIDTASHGNHKNFQKKNNLFLPLELNMSNEINIENNNVDTAHSLVSMEDDEDLNTTQALMSLAMKITSQQEINFKYTDGFEDEKITNANVVNTSNDNQTISSLIQQNGDQNIDSHRHEEEYQISNNSLKLLESLVNIEHSKLEGQPSLIEEEMKQSNVEVKKKRHKKSKEIDLKQDKSQKSKERKHKMLDEENFTSKEKKQENHCSKYKRKSKKRKYDEEKKSKSNNRISETQNKVDNSVQSSLEVLRDQNILSNINGSSMYNSSKKIETTNIKSLTYTTSSVGIILETQDAKNDLSANESYPGDIENISISENECNTITTNNSSLLKTSFIASTSSYERDVDNLKTTSSSQGSVMKSSDYKKIYEKDRKNLFNPDVIIISKSTKDPINDINIKKEYNPIKEKILDKMSITKKNKSVSKKKNHHNCLKVRITSGKINKPHNIKTVLNNTSNSSNQIKPSSKISTVNKFKRPKTYISDDKNKTNVALNKDHSQSTDILVNKVSNIVNNLKSIESNYIYALENQKLKEKDCIQTEESNKDGLENNLTHDWIKQLHVKYNIKPIYIVIDPNRIY